MNGRIHPVISQPSKVADINIQILPPDEFQKVFDQLATANELLITKQLESTFAKEVLHNIATDTGTLIFISNCQIEVNNGNIHKLQLLNETDKIMFEGKQRSQFLNLRNYFAVYTTNKVIIGNLKSKCSCCKHPNKYEISDGGGQNVLFRLEAANSRIEINDSVDGSNKATALESYNKVRLTFHGEMDNWHKILALVMIIVIYTEPGGLYTEEDADFSCNYCCKKYYFMMRENKYCICVRVLFELIRLVLFVPWVLILLIALLLYIAVLIVGFLTQSRAARQLLEKGLAPCDGDKLQCLAMPCYYDCLSEKEGYNFTF